ncbi:MAG: DUF4446 family protein [Gracilibacteraceae bacterium]|jgi:hypothetical protein|nr:DUF4446 family protein [Gracilibacteraceae bacterium]
MWGIKIEIALIIVCVLLLLTMTAVALLWRNYVKFKRAYVSLEKFMSGVSLDELLKANLRQTGEVQSELAAHAARLGRLEAKARSSKDSVQLVRFNSTEKMGAELSFALTFLDQEGSGVLLTSIQSVEECRVYVRSIEKGGAKTRLLAEEQQAVQKALSGLRV